MSFSLPLSADEAGSSENGYQVSPLSMSALATPGEHSTDYFQPVDYASQNSAASESDLPEPVTDSPQTQGYLKLVG